MNGEYVECFSGGESGKPRKGGNMYQESKGNEEKRKRKLQQWTCNTGTRQPERERERITARSPVSDIG